MAVPRSLTPDLLEGTLRKEIERLEKTNQDLLDRIEQLSSLLDNLPGMAFRCLYDEELTFE